MSMVPDPLALARSLIRCPSVTPVDAGALDVLERTLAALGFRCTRLPFGNDPVIDNLYARFGREGPHLCFAGHTDVVPVGDADAWTVAPFGGEVRDGRLWGRGASDMKAAVACFTAAAGAVIAAGPPPGSISFLITGDEEGPARDGTIRLVPWLAEHGEVPDACVVGEPTNPAALGDMIKIGRRGSLNATVTAEGVQGHVAYPDRADNPLPALVRLLDRLATSPLDDGSATFQPSNLELTSIDTGNPATNVIPARATARFNIRFNDRHTAASLGDWIAARCAEAGGRFRVETDCSGEAFVTPPGPLSDLVASAVTAVTGRVPALSTSGGTSDARFIRRLCPVVEFGMVGETAHKVDENVPVEDLGRLTAIYKAVLDGFFADGWARSP